jgi:hypothetical protein
VAAVAPVHGAKKASFRGRAGLRQNRSGPYLVLAVPPLKRQYAPLARLTPDAVAEHIAPPVQHSLADQRGFHFLKAFEADGRMGTMGSGLVRCAALAALPHHERKPLSGGSNAGLGRPAAWQTRLALKMSNAITEQIAAMRWCQDWHRLQLRRHHRRAWLAPSAEPSPSAPGHRCRRPVGTSPVQPQQRAGGTLAARSARPTVAQRAISTNLTCRLADQVAIQGARRVCTPVQHADAAPVRLRLAVRRHS